MKIDVQKNDPKFKSASSPSAKTLGASIMKSELEILSDRELEIEKIVENTYGLMQDKPAMIDQKGIFDEYIEIHKKYVELSENNLEALKRALFIQWYSCSEPSANTGIPGGGGPFDSEQSLDRDAELFILRLLDRIIANNQLDYELKWMLCYYGIWEEYFNYFPETKELKNLNEFIKQRDKFPYPKKMDKKELEARGQMGSYWMSIICR